MKKNILFALAVILLAGVIAVTRVMTRTEGATARVEITDAETMRVIESFLGQSKEFALDGEPRWVWPWEGPCDGMFVAKMKRLAT